MVGDIQYRAIVIPQFEFPARTMHVYTLSGVLTADGVSIGTQTLAHDHTWHDSLYAARCDAAEKIQEYADALADQARRMREAT